MVLLRISVTKIFGYFGLKREEIEEAQAGDLIAVSEWKILTSEKQ